MKKLLFIVSFAICLCLNASDGNKPLIIVTTNEVSSESEKLGEFIRQKEIRGFEILLATKDQYGGEDLNYELITRIESHLELSEKYHSGSGLNFKYFWVYVLKIFRRAVGFKFVRFSVLKSKLQISACVKLSEIIDGIPA